MGVLLIVMKIETILVSISRRVEKGTVGMLKHYEELELHLAKWINLKNGM